MAEFYFIHESYISPIYRWLWFLFIFRCNQMFFL